MKDLKELNTENLRNLADFVGYDPIYIFKVRWSPWMTCNEVFTRMVVKEVERTQPKREENFLSKKDAEKLIKKYTKRYVLQEYLNATEAADVLDMSLTTFWRYRQKHPVPVYVIDGVKRYKKSELIKCVEDNSVRGYA